MKIKTALITGGAAGIGKRTAIQLAKQGISVIINYRNSEDKAKELANFLTNEYGNKNFIIQGDLADLEDCQRVIKEAFSISPTIDIVIHNAGPYIHERKPMIDYSLEEWNYLINGNLNAVFNLCKAFIPKMREQKWGRIITIGFDRVETAPGWIYRSAFAAAKTGLASLTRTISLEEASKGITANMVCPGDITGEWKEGDITEAIDVLDTDSPIGRPGTGEDIARVISFLIDDHSSFITGSVIPVTGGKDVLGKINKL
ncbi:SDR family oxidoreductase [Bacillus massilinigeriensis]|uniref:SDR family oxidoreductase n=1 Tax=Bacillus massilionigeriensis TaxID=1805475 RepID=UPI00096B3CD6|nr:SDR family oxidoreductase [Bacillus massilionigeriensis]